MSFSMYRGFDGIRSIGFFVDDHSINHGVDLPSPEGYERLTVSQYIRRQLETNPLLHVYAEIAPRGRHNFGDSSNQELRQNLST